VTRPMPSEHLSCDKLYRAQRLAFCRTSHGIQSYVHQASALTMRSLMVAIILAIRDLRVHVRATRHVYLMPFNFNRRTQHTERTSTLSLLPPYHSCLITSHYHSLRLLLTRPHG
jgi:hypothetical protein